MRFHTFRNAIWKKTEIVKSLRNIFLMYIISLMISVRKHSLTSASYLSGIGKSAFGRFLKDHHGICVHTLENLSKKEARRFSDVLKKSSSLPWKIFILIDSTFQKRSSLKSENVQKFNHGKGFVIGHQWTNIVLIINGILIPLPPIPFYTKKYCRENNLPYRTENEKLYEYIENLNLKEYIGDHRDRDVIVLTDSGYDDKKLQKKVIKKKWNFISALSSSRGVKSEAEYRKNKTGAWSGVAEFYRKNRIIRWVTVHIFTEGPKRKRKDFRVRHADVFLKGVGKVRTVCSEFRKKQPGGRRKYLACSDLKATPQQIIKAYRIRWRIELFHKYVKMYLGFEDVAAKHFSSVISHVHLVYCAYILLNSDLPGVSKEKDMQGRQAAVEKIFKNREIAADLQKMTRIGGVEEVKNKLKSVLAA